MHVIERNIVSADMAILVTKRKVHDTERQGSIGKDNEGEKRREGGERITKEEGEGGRGREKEGRGREKGGRGREKGGRGREKEGGEGRRKGGEGRREGGEGRREGGEGRREGGSFQWTV